MEPEDLGSPSVAGVSLLSELPLAEHPLGKAAAHSWTLSDTSENLLLVLAVSTISSIK